MKNFAIILSAFAALGSAHMRLADPPALLAINNKSPLGGMLPDYEMIKPLKSTDDFPCKGYHQGFPNLPHQAAVATWEAGTMQSFTVMGNGQPADIPATHGGGSCQVSFSHDGGNTFRVIKSWVGGCVAVNDNSNVRGVESQGNGKMIPTLDFEVPKDVPSGKLLFAWTWFNTLGNREMYMNCASIEIANGATETSAFEARPEIFVANLGDGCATPDQGQVDFPNPGDNVVVATDHVNILPPIGCKAGSGSGGSSSSSESPQAGGGDGQRKAEVVDAPTTSEAPAPVYEAPAPSQEAPAPVYAAEAEAPSPAAPSPAAEAAPSVAFVPVEAPSSGGGALTGQCSENGDWNCIDGFSFQRCAPGGWTVAQVVPPGTKCTHGQGADIQFLADKKRSVGFTQPHVKRHVDRHARL